MEKSIPAPEIRMIEKMNLMGASAKMSIVQNRTAALWKGFRSKLAGTAIQTNGEFISLQVYDPSYFKGFDPSREFTKWAAVALPKDTHTPDGFESFELESGLYAVFHYKGMPGNPAIFQYIYSQWLPQSAYELDQRPHFELLGDRYKNNSPDSEEDIYIPIRPRE